MPEYLAPGVYVEEITFRSKSIEGVPTSTTGFAGMTRYGPVQYPDGPETTEPRLITSFTEFERVYGGLDALFVGDEEGAADERLCYLAHAARAYFENGGKRLYISRVYAPRGEESNLDFGTAHSSEIPVGDITGAWRARWPGSYGNVLIETKVVRSKNLVFTHSIHGLQATRVKPGGVVEILAANSIVSGNAKIDIAKLAVVTLNADGKQKFIRQGLTKDTASDLTEGEIVQLVEMQVIVTEGVERIDVYDELAADVQQKRFIGEILQKDDPEDENSVVWFDYDPSDSALPDFLPAELIAALRRDTDVSIPIRLSGGHDGSVALPDILKGEAADPDVATEKATGLEALGEIDDIAIVALPDGGAYDDAETCAAGGRATDRARRATALPHRRRRRPARQLDERDPRVPRPVRQQVRRALPPVDRDPRSRRAARAGRAAAPAAAAAVGLRRPASTRAATSSAACTRRRPTRSCAA